MPGKKDIITTGLSRLLSLQKSIQELDMLGAMIQKPENIYYFCGVFPLEPSFLIIPSHGEPELVVAGSSFYEAIRDSLVPVRPGDFDIISTVLQVLLEKGCISDNKNAPIKLLWQKIRGAYLGIEYDTANYQLIEALNITSCQDISPIIWQMRSIKDTQEISYIKEACHLTTETLAETLQLIKPGMSERAVSGLFDRLAKEKGADESKAFVRSGKNTAFAFTRWMEGEIGKGTLLIECGARVKGYWSEITRTFYLGNKVDPFFKEIYELVLAGLQGTLAYMEQGNALYEAARLSQDIFSDQKYVKNMIYSVGHSIGLEIHEQPTLSLPLQLKVKQHNFPSWSQAAKIYQSIATHFPDYEDIKFKKNQVFAVEPSLYFEHLGIRIEDMVLIEEKPYVLSIFPKNLTDIIL